MSKLPSEGYNVIGVGAGSRRQDLTENPMKVMVGDTPHYNVGGLDVNRFTMANGWDPCARDIMRYTSRHRVKDGYEAIVKAIHYVGIRQALLAEYPRYWPYQTDARPFSMQDFIAQNEQAQDTLTAGALYALEGWMVSEQEAHRLALLHYLNELRAEYESGSAGKPPAPPAK